MLRAGSHTSDGLMSAGGLVGRSRRRKTERVRVDGVGGESLRFRVYLRRAQRADTLERIA